MDYYKKIILCLILLMFGFSLTIFAYAISNPGTAACALIKLMPIKPMNYLSQAYWHAVETNMSSHQILALGELLTQARLQDKNFF
jgi:hypothetical protein